MSKQGKLKKLAGRVVSPIISGVDKVAQFPKVDEITRLLRIKICEGNSCGKFDAENRQCDACGCKMDKKVEFIKNPVTGEVISCPKKLW